MGILTRLGIAAFIAANAKILFRLVVSSAIILIFNVLYSKYEALLLATNPEKLFIPLYIYTAIVISLIGNLNSPFSIKKPVAPTE